MIYVLSGGQTGATLTVTSSGAGTITVSNTTLGKSYSKSVTAGGSAVFKGLQTGTWTVKLTDGSKTSTKTIAITSDYTTNIAYFSATISITYPAKSTCVVKNSGGTTVASNSNTGSSTKTWTATVNATGTYTITATATDGSGNTKSTTVNITTNGQSESVTLSYYVLYYDAGEQFNDITGGWRAQLGKLTTGNDSLTIAATAQYHPAIATTENKLDMTGIKTLCFEVQFTTHIGTSYPSMGLATRFQSSSSGSDVGSYSVGQVSGDSLNKKLYSVDVSELTGSYYPYIRTYWGDNGSTTANIYKVYGIPE